MQGSFLFYHAMKKFLTTILGILFAVTLYGQGSEDACLFSQTYYQGTAKAMGMGNALGAVGGDMTAICINPAGMGIYRGDEFTTTLNLLDNFHRSSYYGTNNNSNKMRLSIPNLGYVKAKQRSNYRKLRFTQFGIGLTRTNDYNIRTFAQGLNPSSSKTNNSTFLSQIEGCHPDDLPTDVWPIWDTYLIDDHYEGGQYHYTSNVPSSHIWQSQENDFKGRSEEWSFVMSANYSERLFLGMSLNITHIKREGSRIFAENRDLEADNDFVSWSYSEDLSSNALGCNAKIGLLFNACPWLRLGGAFHTRSLYAFDETWQTMTKSQFVTTGLHTNTSQESNYEYTFISPRKWVGSMAFIIDQQGIISLDAEYTNFGIAKFTAEDWDYSYVNSDISSTYGKTFNFRIGSEWSLGDSYLRVGASYYGSPLGFGETNGSVKKASCGISLPVSLNSTFDFAYELTYGQNNIYLYAFDGLQPINHKQFKNNLAATLKVKF